MTTLVRSYSFTGNNVSTQPWLNAAGSAELRITPATFSPGTTNTPIDGPNARVVSNIVVAGNGTLEGPPYSGMMYAWGQFVDHDLDRTANDGVNSIGIKIPADDPTLPPLSIMPLTRAVVDPATGTQVNSVTGWLDASMVYGSDATTAASLRTADGHMATSAGGYLPVVDGQYAAGDVRAAENPDLTALHTLMVREHNHQADQLQQQHPNWDGNQVYDMARSIVTAEIQSITYNEFLPLLLGSKAPAAYQGYNARVDPRITQEFAGSAYRFGHTIVSEEISYLDNNGNGSGSQLLADAFFEPTTTFQAHGGADGLLRHLIGDVSQKYDVHLVDSLRNLLVDPPAGQDLAAVNIERGRDLGMAALNQTRAALGLQPYATFNQLTSDPSVAANLAAVYDGDVNKVELWIGGLAEDPADGALVSSTFQAIIGQQFTALRDGDPLWFENQGFDPATLKEIQTTTLSDLIMRDADTRIAQPNAFLFTERHASDVAPQHPESPQLIVGVDADDATVAGGPADDIIMAGLGVNQQLSGGGGRDSFVFLKPGGTATITDFTPGSDSIDFEATGTSTGSKPLSISTTGDGSTLLKLDGYTVTLADVRPERLSAGDVLFGQYDPVMTPQQQLGQPMAFSAAGNIQAKEVQSSLLLGSNS
jgi:hypothetical protein